MTRRINLKVHYATDVMGILFITLARFSFSHISFRLADKYKLQEKYELNDPIQGMIYEA